MLETPKKDFSEVGDESILDSKLVKNYIKQIITHVILLASVPKV
jgi:hypothetical protein